MKTRRSVLQAIAGFIGTGATSALAQDEGVLDENRNRFLRALLTSFDNSRTPISAAPKIGNASCILTQEHSEGPFFLSAPVRRDISEGKAGLPFELSLQVVAADGCTPLPGVLVEIWHCDAAGNYSGHPEMARSPYATLEYLQWDTMVQEVPAANEDVWLRGAQRADRDGVVQFRTIFPGWYDLRAPHIHVKIGGQNGELFTSQLYFEDATANRVYREHEEYSPYGESPYSTTNDVEVWIASGASGLVLSTADAADGMHASARIGIDQSSN